MRTIINWLENRTGLETAVKNFLYEDIPASAGWHQIIGSMAVFFFVIQVFTGGLLAIALTNMGTSAPAGRTASASTSCSPSSKMPMRSSPATPS